MDVQYRLSLPKRTDEDTQAGLLEDVDIVIVGVAHGPAAGMSSRLVHVRGEDVAAVTVRPFRPAVQTLRDLNRNNRNFIAINTVVAPSQCLRQ